MEPKTRLVLEDSEVAAVVAAEQGVRIRLSAAHVLRSEVSDGQAVPGFARAVELWLSGAVLQGAPGGCIGRIDQGRVCIEGRWASQLALPGAWDGPVMLELAFANRAQLQLQARGLACRYRGEANFSESLSC